MAKSIYSQAYGELMHELRLARRTKGLTQQQLALRLGTTQSVISKCERGERRLDFVETRALCMALGLDFLDFVRLIHGRLSESPVDITFTHRGS